MKIPPAILASLLLSIAGAGVPGAAAAADGTGSSGRVAQPPSGPTKPMNMGEPMATGMMKPGMTNGDVKAAAARYEAKMKALMAKERERRAAQRPPPPSPLPAPETAPLPAY